nr:hypothetical protein L204_02461 [Cryptococcus depauperatus CBS 7855]
MEAHQAREEKRSKRTGDLICTRRFTTDEKEPNNRIGQKIVRRNTNKTLMVWGSSRRRGEARRSQHGAGLRRYGRVLQDELAGGGNKIFELWLAKDMAMLCLRGFDEDDLSTFDANNMVSNDMSESIELGQFQSLWIEMLYSIDIPLDSDEAYRGLGV